MNPFKAKSQDQKDWEARRNTMMTPLDLSDEAFPDDEPLDQPKRGRKPKVNKDEEGLNGVMLGIYLTSLVTLFARIAFNLIFWPVKLFILAISRVGR